MDTSASKSTITVALIGNPNTGKSTLFSALAGVRQRVGNYPGVTIEKKTGQATFEDQIFELIDLPGTYSLAPRSLDEMVTVDVVLGRRSDTPAVDVVLSIVDASNLERNLYLVSQVLDLELPTVIALNMVDVARERGLTIDVPRLQRQLGVSVVVVQANKKHGLHQLKLALVQAARISARPRETPFPPAFVQEVERLQEFAGRRLGAPLPLYLAERLLLDTSGYLQQRLAPQAVGAISTELQGCRDRLDKAGCKIPAVEAIARYGWVARVLDGVVQRPKQRVLTIGDRVDRLLTHKVWGTLVFLALMLLMFSAVFEAAAPAMRAIDRVIAALQDAVSGQLTEGAFRSLLVDGVLGGVGSVVVFLPQIMVLFLFIGLLEDCGYMARAAYLMDKVMVRVGLSGKSFIPLLSSFACAVPGVMATRVIENRRDRLTTILVAPLMSCSARLPVYTILIGAFIPQRSYLAGLVRLQGLTLLGMYLIGIVTAAFVALVLKRTILRGPTPAFVMELPSYKWPAFSNVLYRMSERAWGFLARAGTLILAVSVVIWAVSYYPHDVGAVEGPFAEHRADLETQLASATDAAAEPIRAQLREVDNQIAAAYQRQSLLGRVGRFIEPAVRPLGWDWRIGCAAIASFPAREVVMGVLGVIYNLGSDLDVEAQGDQSRLQAKLQAATWEGTERPVFNVPVALSIMVFFALCAQCASTLIVIKRETGSWRWPIFTFAYMTTLAYLGALATYQIGSVIAERLGS